MDNKELVFIENNRVLTDSLTVAECFGKDHKHVLRDIEVQLQKLKEAGEEEWGMTNFGQTLYQHSQNKQWYKKYLLTEEGFTIVAMSYTTPEAMKMKVKFIEEFKRMKKQLMLLNAPSYMIEDPIKRAERWIEEQREKQKLEQENQVLLLENEELKPKAKIAEQIAEAKNLASVKKVGKNIGIGEKKFFEFLRAVGVFYKEGETNLPKQQYQNSEYFEVKVKPSTDISGNVYNTYVTKVTGKGEVYLLNLVNKYGGAEKINSLKLKDIKSYVETVKKNSA